MVQSVLTFQDEAVVEISGDRRRTRRYAIDLPLQFKARRTGQFGAGRTLDISSRGIAFSGSEILRPGLRVEVSLAWPLRLRQTCPLQVTVLGRVLRSNGHSTALRILHYEFRTQGSSGAFDCLVGGRDPSRRAISLAVSGPA